MERQWRFSPRLRRTRLLASEAVVEVATDRVTGAISRNHIGPRGDYTELGSFTFDKTQYEQAAMTPLFNMRPRIASWTVSAESLMPQPSDITPLTPAAHDCAGSSQPPARSIAAPSISSIWPAGMVHKDGRQSDCVSSM